MKDSYSLTGDMFSNNQEKTERNKKLPLSQNQEWFDVILTNDVNQAKVKLENVAENEQSKLINCPFEYDKSKRLGIYRKSLKRVTLPFHLAVCYGAKDVAELLLQSGADPVAVNENRDNVLHSCVVTALNRPELEQSICGMVEWLQSQVTEDHWKELLFTENDEGFYPLEFAAQQGCLLIFQHLFGSKGHVTSEESCGLQRYRLHDVTSYEVGDRHSKSPMALLCFLDRKILTNDDYLKVVLDPLILGWIEAKIKCNWIPIMFWIIVRLLTTMPYFIVDAGTQWLEYHYGNQSSIYLCPELSRIRLGSSRNYFIAITMILTGLSLLRLIFDSIRVRCLKRIVNRSYDLKGKKNILTNTWFYLRVHILFLLLLVILNSMYVILIVHNLRLDSAVMTIMAVFRSIIPVLFLWSVTYFLQLIPSVGSSVMSMQGMLGDVAKFFLIYIIIVLPFIHVFQAFSLANSIDGCLQQFSSTWMTAYTLFMIMMNMVDLTQFNMNNSGVLYFIHVIYVFMIGIMLLNFLIALMSSTASTFAEHKAVVLKLNQLALVVALEDRAFSVFKRLYRKLRKLTFLCKDEKVYILSEDNRLDTLVRKGIQREKVP